jgi:hypothetical protein
VKPRAKFIIDENSLGIPATDSLKELLSFSPDDAEIDHVIRRFGAGTPDEEWIPRLAEDGWVVITADAGKNRSSGRKLPDVCKEFRITHVIIAPGLHKRNNFCKQRAIVDNWERLLAAAEAPRGSRYSLKLSDPATGRTTLVCVSQPVQDPEDLTDSGNR